MEDNTLLDGMVVWTNLNLFDPDRYFGEYHYYEIFDENKIYNNKTFQADYGKGLLTYRNKKYKLEHNNKEERGTSEKLSTKVYLIVEEELTKDEQNKLLPFCRCQYHMQSKYNPFKILICQCCVGCVGSEFPRQLVINRTRDCYLKCNGDLPTNTFWCGVL